MYLAFLQFMFNSGYPAQLWRTLWPALCGSFQLCYDTILTDTKAARQASGSRWGSLPFREAAGFTTGPHWEGERSAQAVFVTLGLPQCASGISCKWPLDQASYSAWGHQAALRGWLWIHFLARKLWSCCFVSTHLKMSQPLPITPHKFHYMLNRVPG